jgi:hypothetical protein
MVVNHPVPVDIEGSFPDNKFVGGWSFAFFMVWYLRTGTTSSLT